MYNMLENGSFTIPKGLALRNQHKLATRISSSSSPSIGVENMPLADLIGTPQETGGASTVEPAAPIHSAGVHLCMMELVHRRYSNRISDSELEAWIILATSDRKLERPHIHILVVGTSSGRQGSETNSLSDCTVHFIPQCTRVWASLNQSTWREAVDPQPFQQITILLWAENDLTESEKNLDRKSRRQLYE